jgi:hypothetical protein
MKKVASSGTVEGLQKLINEFFCSESLIIDKANDNRTLVIKHKSGITSVRINLYYCITNKKNRFYFNER